MKNIKETLPTIFGVAFIVLSLVACVFGFTDQSEKDNEPNNGNYCSEMVYFNKIKHKTDTCYSNVNFIDDSLTYLTSQTGKKWKSSDFIEIKNNDDTWDITVSDGERFRFSILDDTICGNKHYLDSLKKQ